MNDIPEPNSSSESAQGEGSTGESLPAEEIFTGMPAEAGTSPQNGPADIALSAGEASLPVATLVTEMESLPPSPSLPVGSSPANKESGSSNKRLLALFIRDDELKALWDRATRAQKEVDAHINNLAMAGELFAQIEMARNELMAGKENFELAERHINEVEYRVALSQRVARLSASLGIGLFIYETAWALVLLLFLFLVLGPAAFSSAAQPSAAWMSPDVVFLLGSMTWGGLGGVIGAWLSLVKHIARDQDFDRQHMLWYINSPVMGIGVGAVIYLVLRAGLLSITGPTEGINSPLVIYLLAWLSGFQQNVFTDLIRRLLQVFKIEGDGEGGEPVSAHTTRTVREEHPENGRA